MSGAVSQIWWATTACFVLAFATTMLAQRLDSRQIKGENVWVKPAKFALSLALHFLTLALVADQLGSAWQGSGVLIAVALLASACGALELAYIAFQASRQLPSHFYVGTPLYAGLYAAMGLGAVLIVLAAGLVGAIVWLDPSIPLAGSLRSALVLGLVGGTFLTLITAFRLGANMSHAIGTEAPGAARMPLTGWSITVGDLRPAHFLATHMMQAVPVVGLVAAWLLPEQAATLLVWLFAAGWTWLTLATFRLALAGRPLRLALR
ncbi:hypothetical protein [Devosia beringensis]|uniref:hypothetical protein n=1 Tax=Devosia beringensis TaxID=2657486 RepID=UPI00186BAE0C|nr:hypothetical protein [Devosia beringensis]